MSGAAALDAQREAAEKFRAGQADAALDILGDYIQALEGSGLEAAKVAQLRRPVESRLQHFKLLKAQKEFLDKIAAALDAALDYQLALADVERIVGARFGDPGRPLLVSVRSGAKASMPGMMDTVLNLGLNDATVEGLAAGPGLQGLH